MNFILAAAIIIFLIIFSFILISFVDIDEREIIRCENKPILKFKDFKKYYYLNPSSWILYDCSIYKDGEEFTFSFLDMIRYRTFYKKKINKERILIKKERNKQAYIKFLNSIQKDIDDILKEDKYD